MTYLVNEIFHSLQGEGKRAGEPSTFVRFSKCNLQCSLEPGEKSPGGFDCDTEFESGTRVEIPDLLEWIQKARGRPHPVEEGGDKGSGESAPQKVSERGCGAPWLVLTGGEPGLQVDLPLTDALHEKGYRIAIETNGSVALPSAWKDDAEIDPDRISLDMALAGSAFDWITVSPKVAEHAVRQLVAHEVKYVRTLGQAIPLPRCRAYHYLLSPAFNGTETDRETVAWVSKLALENPPWEVTVQMHKVWSLP